MAFGLEISCVKNGHQTWNTMKCGWTMADLHGKVQVQRLKITLNKKNLGTI